VSKLKYDETLAQYDALVATQPEVPRKGKGSPYTSVNGWMFSMLAKDVRLGMRLSKEKRAEFNNKYATGEFLNYGAVILEYSEIPPDLLKNTDELAPWFAESYGYTKYLKPKLTTKRKK
jgi:hypothetical protein